MTEEQQILCEAQASFFESSIDLFRCGSSYFISRFMNSDIAKKMDAVGNGFEYYDVPMMTASLSSEFESLNRHGKERYPKPVLHWMGYIYRAWCIIKRARSSQIYRIMKAERMLSLYDAFHTFDPEYCVERIYEMLQEEGMIEKRTDYEIFRSIMLS